MKAAKSNERAAALVDELYERFHREMLRASAPQRIGLRKVVSHLNRIRREIRTCRHESGGKLWNLVREAMRVAVDYLSG